MNVMEVSSFVVILAIVVGVGVASRRRRMGEPFRQRPAAIVLSIVGAIVAILCVILAMRHGG
jgi:hypothetical protein